MKNIALTGGGTAGHITPNLALIPELTKRGFNVIYIGYKNGMEKSIVENRNIPFFGIDADKLRRYIDVKNLMMPLNVVKGILEAKEILKNNKIDVVFSKGGFVAVPVVIAANILKIPVISHEADFTPGLANKIASPHSKIICTNFLETSKMFGSKGVHTGCPIRQKLMLGDTEKGKAFLNFQNDKPIIFVTGGSLGAQYINNLIKQNLDKLLPYVNIVLSCGKGKLDMDYIKVNETTGKYENTRPGYKQFELIVDELPDIFAASDLIISRAGANIIFELLALKKLNLLIPLSKKASRGDQILNAKSFEKQNYSVILYEEEQNKNPELFYKKLLEIKDRKDEILKAMNNAKENNAINNICDIIENALKKSMQAT